MFVYIYRVNKIWEHIFFVWAEFVLYRQLIHLYARKSEIGDVSQLSQICNFKNKYE